MSTCIPRRSILVGTAALGLRALSAEVFAAARERRPICRFSLVDGWSDEAPAEYITRQASADDRSGVPQVVARIKKELGFRQTFDIFIAEQEDNAFAAVANGRKILVVDVGFLEKLNKIARTQWGAIQVIAHEVGHHIAGFSQDSHRSELNADYWSGQSLQRLGSSKQASTAAILAFGTEIDTPSHPNKRRRAQTISRGWEDASQRKIDYSFCDDCR